LNTRRPIILTARIAELDIEQFDRDRRAMAAGKLSRVLPGPQFHQWSGIAVLRDALRKIAVLKSALEVTRT
jgi:hypothetical protein